MSQPRKKHSARLSAAKTTMVAPAAPVTVTAAASDNSTPPTFSAVAYSGSIVNRGTVKPQPEFDYVIDLAGMTQGRNGKANLDHQSTQRVGHLTDYANDGNQVIVTGALSADTEHKRTVANSAAQGYPWELSIEANLSKPEKLPSGKSAVVNGRTVNGPLVIYRKSVLTDVGFVSHGADAGNQVTVAASAAGEVRMSEFETFAASLGIDLDTATDAVKANLQNLHAVHVANKPKQKTSIAELADAQRRETQREEQINQISLAAMKEHPMFIDQIETAAKTAMSESWAPDRFELELIRATRSKAGQFRAQMSGTQADPTVIEAALAMASGLPNIEKHYKENVLEAVDRCKLGSISLQQVIMQNAIANGYHCAAGERISSGNLRSVLKAAFADETQARLSGFSTISLPNILGAVANKQILAGYMEEDSTWREVARIKSVTNFYTQNHYRMLDSMEYEEVGSGGEVKHGTLGEETYTSQAKTYGKTLGITRTQIINDDLGAFDDVRSILGEGAAIKFGNVFWTAFMNNASFYTSARTNYIEGSTTNLGTDGVGLGLAVKGCRLMRSPSADGSKRIGNGFRPEILLVPPELEQIATALYIASNGNNVAVSSANTHANKYRPVVQNRLSDTAFTGNSSTAFYMVGGNVNMKPMLVTLLNGRAAPIIDSTDADFSVLGVLFRGIHDFGCDKGEYLGSLKSKGAS
jgi:phage major head subunit gpT-like protein